MRTAGRLLVGALATALLTLAACKTGKSGTVPVNNPTAQWEAPDADDLVQDDEDEAGDTGDEE